MRTNGFYAAVLLLATLVLAPVAPVHAAPAPVTLKQPKDLAQLGREARRRHLPILLMFGLTECSYCHLVAEDFLKPMLRSGDYTDKILIRRLDIDHRGAAITDFDGRPTTLGALADRYRVTVTPTVVFLGPEGQALASRMVGVTTPDYYGGYLDQHIDTALAKMRPAGAAPTAP